MTWRNKQDINTLILSKLDRALTNVAWQLQYLATSVVFLPAGVSDRSLILVTVYEDKHSGSRFSLLNCWVDHPTYHNLVKEAWMEPVQGSLIFTLFSRLKNVKTRLRTLHKERFTQIAHRVQACRDQLYDCQREIQDNLSSADLYRKKNSWPNILPSGVHERQQQQIIGHIKDKDRNERIGLDNEDDIAALIKPIDMEEIKAVVFSIGSDKSPGPDGFSSAFFKAS
ncbi:uncharacterized protein LOC141626407 [Silene latifolia]|uniref:uncharacterized protein LOC141626407 n=1 Tax=Silene latifolia TaxID=37657 RepID=UPI003D779992